MNKNDVISVLETERECVMRAEYCDRDCAKCDLVMPSDKIISAYNYVIEWLKAKHE